MVNLKQLFFGSISILNKLGCDWNILYLSTSIFINGHADIKEVLWGKKGYAYIKRVIVQYSYRILDANYYCCYVFGQKQYQVQTFSQYINCVTVERCFLSWNPNFIILLYEWVCAEGLASSLISN